MSNKGLIYGLGSILAIAAAKNLKKENKRKSSRNVMNTVDHCSSCSVSEASSVRELMNTFVNCGYYWPQTEQIFEELLHRDLQNRGSMLGSFAKVNVKEAAKRALDESVNSNIITPMQRLQVLGGAAALTQKDEKGVLITSRGDILQNEFYSLLGKIYPYQVGILVNELEAGNPDSLKKIAELSESVNSRIFINRYLQRTAFIISEEMASKPIFVEQEQYKKKWTCDNYSRLSNEYSAFAKSIGARLQGVVMSQDFEDFQNSLEQQASEQQDISKKQDAIVQQQPAPQKDALTLKKEELLERLYSEVEIELNQLGLDLNRERLIYKKSPTGDYLYKQPKLDMFSSIEKLSDVRWFIDMAKSCGIQNSEGMYFTFPRESLKIKTQRKAISIFDQVDYTLHYPVVIEKESGMTLDDALPSTSSAHGISKKAIPDPKLSNPYIYFYQKESDKKAMICMYSYASGYLVIEKTPVFTKTSKMNTISFSIPAGSPRAGGSCTVAEAKPSENSGKNFICRGCYALKNRYQMLDYVFSSGPRMNWLIDAVEEGDFPSLMSLAIESYARFGYGQGRQDLEIGYMQNGSLMYRSGISSFNSMPAFDINVKHGGKRVNVKNSQEFLSKGGKNTISSRENKPAGYFRIHDSGDFSISFNSEINQSYIRGWGSVANTFPNIMFWGPTRLWTMVYKDPKQEISAQKFKEQEERKEAEASRNALLNRIGVFASRFFGEENIKKIAEQRLKAQAENKRFKEKTKEKKLAAIPSRLKSIQSSFQSGLGEKIRRPKVQSVTYAGYKHRLMHTLADVCAVNPNLIIRPSGLTIVSPLNNNFIGIPMLGKARGYESIAAGSGVNAVFVKNSAGNSFTPAAYEYLEYKEAFGETKEKTLIKRVIGQYLVTFFSKVYNKTANIEKLPRYMYTPIYRQDDLMTSNDPSTFSPVYQCPVNLKTNAAGRAINSGDSCKKARCRFCWLAKDEAVTYGAH